MAKTKALISFAVTAKLICVFVFANANCWFRHAQAQIMFAANSKETSVTDLQFLVWVQLVSISNDFFCFVVSMKMK